MILGAGLDSFGYRRFDLAKVLRVFAVDHPATLAWKRNRVQEAGIALSANLSLVLVDLEKQSLIESLRMSGYHADASAVLSWLGVATYLMYDAIFRTLRTVAELEPGKEIIFQYTVPKELLVEESQRMLAAVMAFAASRGEPFKSFFEPNLLVQQLQKLGFAELSDLGPDEAAARYFSSRMDGLRELASEHSCARGSARDPSDLECSGDLTDPP